MLYCTSSWGLGSSRSPLPSWGPSTPQLWRASSQDASPSGTEAVPPKTRPTYRGWCAQPSGLSERLFPPCMIFTTRGWSRGQEIWPNASLLTLLPSGRRLRSLNSMTERVRRSFYPQAVRHSFLIFIYLFYLIFCSVEHRPFYISLPLCMWQIKHLKLETWNLKLETIGSPRVQTKKNVEDVNMNIKVALCSNCTSGLGLG